MAAYTWALLLTILFAALLFISNCIKSESRGGKLYALILFAVVVASAAFAWHSNRTTHTALTKVEKEAAPLQLSVKHYSAMPEAAGVLVTFVFARSKDVPTGTVAFEVDLPKRSPAQILSISPAMNALNESAPKFTPSHHAAGIKFDVPGNEDPAVEFMLSGLSHFRIRGSPGLKPVEFDMGLAPPGKSPQ